MVLAAKLNTPHSSDPTALHSQLHSASNCILAVNQAIWTYATMNCKFFCSHLGSSCYSVNTRLMYSNRHRSRSRVAQQTFQTYNYDATILSHRRPCSHNQPAHTKATQHPRYFRGSLQQLLITQLTAQVNYYSIIAPQQIHVVITAEAPANWY